MTFTPTFNQLDALRVIVDYWRQLDRAPTRAELAHELDIGKSGAQRLVDGLEQRGWFERRQPGQQRDLRPVPAAFEIREPQEVVRMKHGDPGPKPKFKWLSVDTLVVDERYQRSITKHGRSLIQKIVAEFRWSKFTPVTVAGPDKIGDYAVVDGQHRVEAARQHPDIEKIPCWVVPETEVAGQADTFLGINKDRQAVTRVGRFWAELARGDETAVAIKGVCDRAGVAISRTGTGRQKPLHTIAVAAIGKAIKLGEEQTIRALSCLVRGQAECENAFRSQSILALVRMFGLHGDRLVDDRIVAFLEDMDLDSEIENARGIKEFFGGKTEDALLAILIRAYNKNLRADNRLPDFRP